MSENLLRSDSSPFKSLHITENDVALTLSEKERGTLRQSMLDGGQSVNEPVNEEEEDKFKSL